MTLPSEAAAQAVSKCSNCGSTSTFRCSLCKSMRYCTKECQKEHWVSGGHKQECPSLKAKLQANEKDPRLVSTSVGKKKEEPDEIAPIPNVNKKKEEPGEVAPIPKQVLFEYAKFLRYFTCMHEDGEGDTKQPVLFEYAKLLHYFTNMGEDGEGDTKPPCLVRTRPLVTYLMQRQHSPTCSKPHPNEWCVVCEMENLVVQAQGGSSGKAINPRAITRNVKKIAPHFTLGRQERPSTRRHHSSNVENSASRSLWEAWKAINPRAISRNMKNSASLSLGRQAPGRGRSSQVRRYRPRGIRTGAKRDVRAGPYLGNSRRVPQAPSFTDPHVVNTVARTRDDEDSHDQFINMVVKEDSHDLFINMVDKMESAMLHEAGGRQAFDVRTRETTLLGHTFNGYVGLEIQLTKGVTSVKSGLDAFFEEEVLDADNQYKCDRCKERVCARRVSHIEVAPNVLAITLKRFGLGRYGKITKMVSYQEELELNEYKAHDAIDHHDASYRLYGVLVHIDSMSSTMFGHYVSYVRADDDTWYLCDDSHVDVEEAMSQKAYMLFYLRQQAHPAPDPAMASQLPQPTSNGMPPPPKPDLKPSQHHSQPATARHLPPNLERPGFQ
eukprot:gene7245-355_t